MVVTPTTTTTRRPPRLSRLRFRRMRRWCSISLLSQPSSRKLLKSEFLRYTHPRNPHIRFKYAAVSRISKALNFIFLFTSYHKIECPAKRWDFLLGFGVAATQYGAIDYWHLPI